MKKKKSAAKGAKKDKAKDLWKNPSYKNMLNPYESKYPQPKKKTALHPEKTSNTKPRRR